MTIRNLIFDLDGTLIDSSGGVVEAVNYSLKMMGEPIQEADAIKKFIGFPLYQMYPVFTDAPVNQLCQHFKVKAAETVVNSTCVLPGVEAVLGTLHDRGFRMAIATTKIKEHVAGIVAKFGWNAYFDATVGGNEVAKVKPDPAAFYLALERLGVVADESMAVGDTINDILAAQAVPMKVAAVRSPYGNGAEVEAAQPDHLLESIEELTQILP